MTTSTLPQPLEPDDPKAPGLIANLMALFDRVERRMAEDRQHAVTTPH